MLVVLVVGIALAMGYGYVSRFKGTVRVAGTVENPKLVEYIENSLYSTVGQDHLAEAKEWVRSAGEANAHGRHPDNWRMPTRGPESHGPGNVQEVEVTLTDGRKLAGIGRARCSESNLSVPMRAIFEGGHVTHVFTDGLELARRFEDTPASNDARSFGEAIVSLRPASKSAVQPSEIRDSWKP